MVFDHNCLILSTPRVLFCAGSIPFVQHSPAIVLVPADVEADVQTCSGYRTQYLDSVEKSALEKGAPKNPREISREILQARSITVLFCPLFDKNRNFVKNPSMGFSDIEFNTQSVSESTCSSESASAGSASMSMTWISSWMTSRNC